MKENEKWYVAITRDVRGNYNFTTAYGNHVGVAKAFVRSRGLKIVAEERLLSEKEMDNITGAIVANSDDRGIRAVVVGPEHLRNLVRRLHRERGLDAQEELTKLRNSPHRDRKVI